LKLTLTAVFVPLVAAGAITTADNAVRASNRLLHHVDELGDGAAFAARHADEIGDTARIATRHGDNVLETAVSKACRGNSFTAGTPVETDNGPKSIEDIQEGDKALAEDPETGEQGYFEVVALTNHPTDEILRITIKSSDDDTADEQEDGEADNTEDGSTRQEVMEITPDHPVYVEDEGWLLAENVEEGGRLRRADGGMATVLSIEREQLDEPESIYNFTVRGLHTYFVLDAEVLVHNTSCSINLKTGAPEPESWAPRQSSAHSRDLQRAFIAGLNDGEAMAVRSMDWGVWSWSKAGADIPFKPMAATRTILPGPAGFRHTNAGIFLADADVAWAIKFDPDLGSYRLIDNDIFHNDYRVRIGDAFSNLGHNQNPVLHGPHMNVELMFEVQGKTAADFGGHDIEFFRDYHEREVFIYGNTGYLGSGEMKTTLDNYLGCCEFDT